MTTFGMRLGSRAQLAVGLVLGCAGRSGDGGGTGGSGTGSSGGGGTGTGGAATGGASGTGTGGASGGAGGGAAGAGGAGGTATASYLIGAPNACDNQFFVKGCQNGNAATTCAGQCTVANACSPPEDPGKSALPKTF